MGGSGQSADEKIAQGGTRAPHLAVFVTSGRPHDDGVGCFVRCPKLLARRIVEYTYHFSKPGFDDARGGRALRFDLDGLDKK